MKKILMIIAPLNFRDEELFEPKSVFEKNGFEVVIASKGTKNAKGMLGGTTNVNLDISEVDVSEYDAIIFVGGSGAAEYFNDKIALEIAKDANKKEKIVGAICIAPSILANAGILNGKKATSFPSEEQNLISKGVIYTNDGVTIDGRLVTANGPKFARKFGEEIARLLLRKKVE